MNITLALVHHFNPYRNLILFEAPIRSASVPQTGRFGTWSRSCEYFADLLVVTPSGYATEVEIKTSRADWRADLAKDKWKYGLPDWVSRFIYAVPAELGIPEWVPPKAGVLHFSCGRFIKIARAPGRIGKAKISDKTRNYMLHRTYVRYWSQQMERLRDGKHAEFRDRAYAYRVDEGDALHGAVDQPEAVEAV